MLPKELQRLQSRAKDTHKGDFGHVLVLAGSVGLTGAAFLTSQAAVLSGSGLVTLGIARSLNSIMEIKLTEVMTKPLAQTASQSLSLKAWPQIKKLLPRIDVLAVGPGLSQDGPTKKLVQKLLCSANKPLVLDADGINALIGKLEILGRYKSDLVITPHPGEMARLLNLSLHKIQSNRLPIARNFAKRYKLTVVLKGYQTVVAAKDGQSYENRTGNPGLASGGCGDVLTGMIAAFLGQGLKPFSAAKLATYLHGLAADYAAKEKGQLSLIASDILDKLPQILSTRS